MPVPYPSFFLVGANKSGTSALFRQLDAHPDLGFPRKELHYFSLGFGGRKPDDPRVISSEEEYRALYAPLAGCAVLGDASPSYLDTPGAGERLHDAVPDARVAMILRHPVDRLYSDYLHEQAAGREDRSLAAALDEDDATGRKRYRWRSRYAQHLEVYLSLFDREQIEVHLFEDFRADEAAVTRSLYRFAGVRDDFEAAPSQQSQRSGVVRSEGVNKALRSESLVRRTLRSVLPKRLYRRLGYSLYNVNIKERDPLDPELRASLCAEFEPDVLAVEEVTGRDLPGWRR